MLSQRIFSKKSKGDRTVYLDYAAATPLDAEVAVIMHQAEREHFANASAIHGDAVKAAAAINASRAKLATLIDVNPDELIFTSGGTESDNLALFGVVREAQKKGITPHIIVSAIEHSAVLEAAVLCLLVDLGHAPDAAGHDEVDLGLLAGHQGPEDLLNHTFIVQGLKRLGDAHVGLVDSTRRPPSTGATATRGSYALGDAQSWPRLVTRPRRTRKHAFKPISKGIPRYSG